MSKPDPLLLNGICPYFTMFPLEFPLSVLRERARPQEWVIDPFCGRGTTNFACRSLGLSSFGIDSSPVAVASSKAKLVQASPITIKRMASRILREAGEPRDLPNGPFWQLAYDSQVLKDLCRLRESLLLLCESDARIALRGILLGALHGPLKKNGTTSYLSNQCPRTYAPKPAYSVRYWQERDLKPPKMQVMDIIAMRAERYYGNEVDKTAGRVVQADSREPQAFRWLARQPKADWVITSPPYYGMRTYIPDQWLRNWFVGGPAEVDYSTRQQLTHHSPEEFAQQLRSVWKNLGQVCNPNARMVIRFGGINVRKADPQNILLNSLSASGWRMESLQAAGTASHGKRQADHFLQKDSRAAEEFDLWARLSD
jgi:hypothetical protein